MSASWDDEPTSEWRYVPVRELDADGRLRSALLEIRARLSDACGEAEHLGVESRQPIWWDDLLDMRVRVAELLSAWDDPEASL